MIAVGQDVVRKLANLPPPPPDNLEPTRLADPSRLTGYLREAGFVDIVVEHLPVTFEFDSPASFTQFRYEISPTFSALVNSQSPALRQQILDGVTQAAAAFTDSSGKMRTINETILFAAHR